ncbi:hypothetical protein [Azohydromonas sp.]|uniref:hypothetical protein n=1 Tax=Azohydromonas sp. TaxID=1872666 RepID=UPI002B79E094|nr:hypothetical protein [Azohydromonas sp.]HMM85340.1 hypothetical protein [Azohydromonas sp.]
MFFRIGSRLLNIDRIVSVNLYGKVFCARMSDGSTVDFSPIDADDLERATSLHVPSRPGDTMLVVTYYGNTDDGPEYEVDEVPVVAWRIVGPTAEPVTVDELGANQRGGIVMPDGKVCAQYDTTWPTREKFIESMVSRLREREAKHA